MGWLFGSLDECDSKKYYEVSVRESDLRTTLSIIIKHGGETSSTISYQDYNCIGFMVSFKATQKQYDAIILDVLDNTKGLL